MKMRDKAEIVLSNLVPSWWFVHSALNVHVFTAKNSRRVRKINDSKEI